MARNAHDGSEGSLVTEALDRMVETLTQSSTQSLSQSLTQSLEGVREAARQEALNSERRLQEALRKAQERFQEALNRVEEGFQEALGESEDRAVARSAEQCRQAVEEENSAEMADIKELEGRMRILEDSINTALERVFPQVETLVQQLEERSPPASSTSPSSALPSAVDPSTALPSSSSNRSLPSRSSSSSPSSTSIELNFSRIRALFEAVRKGELEVTRKLLDEGANVNYSNENGRTPLHTAAQCAHADVVSLLVDRGADVNEIERLGNTALHFAARKDTTGRCVDMLISAGADVNLQNDRGWTALHFAAAFGQERAARALLAAGASKTVENEQGRTPRCEATTPSLIYILHPYSHNDLLL